MFITSRNIGSNLHNNFKQLQMLITLNTFTDDLPNKVGDSC